MKEDKGAERQSLITNSERGSVNVKPTPKIRLDTIIVFVFIVVMLVLMCISFYGFITEDHQVAPTRVAIPWYADRPIVMELGTSRVFQPNLYSGNDNRAYNNFQQVTKREIEWSVDPAGTATVDMYGRVNAIKEGECKLKLKSLANPEATDERTIKVVTKRTDIDKVPKRVINFKGEPADTLKSLQKLVERMSAAEALKDPLTPTTVKYAIEHLDQKYSDKVIDGTVTWTITQYADKSDKQYILRTDSDKNDTDRDKLQYFIGDRYLPDAGNSVLMIESDKNNGLWVVGASGNVTHIKMVVMNYRDKAETMNDMTEQFVMRQGLASGASFDGTKWVPEVSDNDGLWTSMYGAGELMKYSVLREKKADPAVVAKARERALKSLKAVLLTANVAGRQGKIPARIRHLNNTRSRLGPKYSKEYLLKGKYNIRDIYSGIPADGNGLYGNDAGKVVDGEYISGRFKYSMLPLNKNDWGTTGAAATTERTLDGFMSRTFVIPAVGPSVPDSGLFFRRHSNGTHSVLSGAHNLYDYERTDHPDLQLGSKPIPQVLKSILNINGVQYDVDDLVYKGDTSTDEVIGHLFIYKIAYDILDENNEQQNQLKQLIRQTMRNFCQHLINNGYILADATGQATTWSKLYKQFFTTDYTTQDTSLKIIQLLLSFKVAYYVTGQKKWKDQYDLLTLDPQFRYIDIYSHVWDKWIWLYTKCDDLQDKLFRFNSTMAPSDIELERHLLYQFHFSDEEEAYLAYYLIFQLEENPQLREQFRYGLDAYWHSISKSENPLWYYIYQLASPDKPVKDSFDQDLRQVSAWQLSRHMIDTREYQAYVKGSRPDVIHEGPISVNPFKVVGKRTNTDDEKYVNTPENKKTFQKFNPNNIYEVKALPADERSIHKFNGATFENIDSSHNPNSMQPSTTYTLPYWLGVYHNLIKLD